jgi:sialate O-acetylesterase
MKKNFFLVISLFIFCRLSSFSEVRLPAILGDHMVLQQQGEVKLWGWCDAGEKITVKVSWDTATYKTTGSSNAKWMLKIKTPEAGGPYKITIQGYNFIELQDVMIGEVWICSGQSNMEMNYNWGLKQYTGDVNDATNKHIRFFHIPRLTSNFPQDDTKGKWVVCNPNDVKLFSLVGYFFGKSLQENLNVPVGLINASWGGTPAETWTPKEIIEKDSILKQAAALLKPATGWPVVPASTYNAMIYPLTNFNIAGAIWYQGEANTGTAKTYHTLLTAMISSWRNAWQKDFPFYYVQIAPFTYGDNINGALLREAQTKTLSYPKTGMIVITDFVPDVKDIHPPMKKEVGGRLAAYVLADNYGKSGGSYKSPMYRSMKIEKDKIRISFDNAGKGLIVKGEGAPTEFYIAGEDKIFLPAKAKIENNTVMVWNKLVKYPVAVRFGFTNTSIPNLFSKEARPDGTVGRGLPVNLFRTDDWDVITEQVKK